MPAELENVSIEHKKHNLRRFPPNLGCSERKFKKTMQLVDYLSKDSEDEKQAPWDRQYSLEEAKLIAEDLKPTISSLFSHLEKFRKDGDSYAQADERARMLCRHLLIEILTHTDEDIRHYADQSQKAAAATVISRTYGNNSWREYWDDPESIPDFPHYIGLILATTSECLSWQVFKPLTDYKDYPNPFFDKYQIFNAGVFAQGFKTLDGGTDCYVVQLKPKPEIQTEFFEFQYPISTIEAKLAVVPFSQDS